MGSRQVTLSRKREQGQSHFLAVDRHIDGKEAKQNALGGIHPDVMASTLRNPIVLDLDTAVLKTLHMVTT